MSALGGAAQTQMERAAEEAGLGEWISSFPDAYDTTLGSLTEGGANLSGGQWQRLAIARMLYREAGVYLWDEPTAAMDPLAESKLYSAFLKKRSDNLTNIFIPTVWEPVSVQMKSAFWQTGILWSREAMHS